MHPGIMQCLKGFHEKFKISKENQGDKLVITFAGSKEDVDKMDKKIDALKVLTDDCCQDGKDDCCCCC